MDLPSEPLFKEQTELASLPQIALTELLKKYNGVTSCELTTKDKDDNEYCEKKHYLI